MLEFISIKELTKELGYKDTRSTVKWCENKNVGILSDRGSKWRYIIKAEFEAARMQEALKYLKGKYNRNGFTEAFNSQMDFFVEYKQANDKKMKEYKPQGEKEKSFLSILQKITSPV